jgi:sugar (glycoside-pentoside-hexuronide) transporter
MELMEGSSIATTTTVERLPLRERVSYGLLDTAGQLVFTMINSYLLYFYTDVAGIAVSVAGTILLVARIIDAIDAPVWGIIIDKTNTRWGKCRPYFLWMSVPLGLMGALTFWTPEGSSTVKIVYASITYVLVGIIYTGLNTPLTAILPFMTRNPNERIVLNTYRMVGSVLGVFFVSATALPLVSLLGQGNDKKGFGLTMLALAVLSITLNLIAFSNIRERNKSTSEKPLPIRESLRAARSNWPLILIVISNLLYWIGFAARASTLIYYFTYNLGNKSIVTLMNSLVSLSIGAIVLIPFFLGYLSRRNLWLVGLAMAIGGQLMIYLAGSYLPLIIAGWIIANLGSGIAVSLPFAMIGSAVDFGEWKTGIKAAGLLTAIGSSLCIKAGSGLGGFIPSIIMGAFDYRPDAVQTPQGLLGIELAFIWLPIGIFLLAAIPLLFYQKYEAMETQITAAILERNAEKG